MEQSNYKSGNKILIFSLGFALAFIVFFFINRYSGKGETIKGETPEVKGKTEISKPENKPLEELLIKETQKESNQFGNSGGLDKWESIADSLLNRNIQLEIAFAKAKNKDSLYREAVQLNTFSKTWDNDTIRINVLGISKGTVEAIQADWTIKKRTHEVKVPQTYFRVLGGIGAGINKELNQGVIKASLGVQNKKGDVILGSYQKIGSQDFFLAEYNISILNFKK